MQTKKKRHPPKRAINGWQIAIGTLALAVGLAVYLVDRPAEATYFVRQSPVPITFSRSPPALFGRIGFYLPTFVHVFGFILITAGLTGAGPRGFLSIVAGWCLVDILFELGQKYHAVVDWIPESFAGIPFLENTRSYFLRGRFDQLDILAVLLGALAACGVYWLTGKRSRG
jgi:hypothetical protein